MNAMSFSNTGNNINGGSGGIETIKKGPLTSYEHEFMRIFTATWSLVPKNDQPKSKLLQNHNLKELGWTKEFGQDFQQSDTIDIKCDKKEVKIYLKDKFGNNMIRDCVPWNGDYVMVPGRHGIGTRVFMRRYKLGFILKF